MAKLFIFAGNFCNISVFIQCENKVELVTLAKIIQNFINQTLQCFHIGSAGDICFDGINIIFIKIIAGDIIAVFAFNLPVLPYL